MEPQATTKSCQKHANRIILIEAFRCCFYFCVRGPLLRPISVAATNCGTALIKAAVKRKRSGRKKRRVTMQARLLLKRFSQVAILAKAAYLNRAVQSSVPTAAYLQHLFSSPLHFVVKAVGPAMAPTINDGVAERAVGHVRAPFTHKSNPALSQFSRRSFSVQFLCSILFVSAT